MLWVLLGISSHFIWAIGNIADKFIVSKKIKNPYVYLISMSIIGGAAALFVIPFIDFYVPNKNLLYLIFAGSAIYFFGGFPYIRAMQLEEPSRINIWWNLIPIFSFLIGWLFLGDIFSGEQIIAFVFLVLGTFIASFHATKKKLVFSKAVFHMMIACFAYSLYGLIFYHLAKSLPFTLLFVWFNLLSATLAVAILFVKKMRLDFTNQILGGGKNLLILIIVLSLLDSVAIFFNQWALSFKHTALVFALEGFQVIFVFILAILLSIYAPKIIKEEIDKKNLILKFLALASMLVGILILYLS